jgi:hypothetical protein
MSQSESLFSPSPSHSFILLAASCCRRRLPSGVLPCPAAQELDGAGRTAEEVVLGGAQHRLGAGDGRVGVLEVGGRVGGAADLAVVAVLVLGAALGAFALDEAVGQEHVLDRVVELLDGAGVDEPGAAAV